MASRAKQNPVGSAGWVFDERQYATRCVEEEVEEFTYAARNEIEWLNEHMAEIFNRKDFNVSEAFKTPGKLRGKTPRTARKRNPLEERAPLTDVFAPTPNAQASPSTNTTFYKQVSKLQFSNADKENVQSPRPARSAFEAPKSYVDSGFHDMADDEVPRIPTKSPARQLSPPKTGLNAPNRSPPKPAAFARLQGPAAPRQSRDTQEASFVSAKEVQSSQPSSVAGALPTEDAGSKRRSARLSQGAAPMPGPLSDEPQPEVANESAQNQMAALDMEETGAPKFQDSLNQDATQEPPRPPASPSKAEEGTQRSLSETPSPEPPATMLRKKSSLSFATLPAREPLGKKSMGNRVSRVSHIDRAKLGHSTRMSPDGRSTVSKKRYFEDSDDEEDVDLALEDPSEEEVQGEEQAKQTVILETSKVQKKTSTQRLHERITMLGKMNPPRPSKSIPAASVPLQHSSTDVEDDPAPVTESQPTELGTEEDDDEWIAPMKASQTTVKVVDEQQVLKPADRPISQASADRVGKTAPAEGNLTMDMVRPKTATYPDLGNRGVESTTPVGSPARKDVDNALSASRSKLFSWARGIFASSAGASAKGKMEVLSPPPSRSRAMQGPPASPTRTHAPYPAIESLSADSMQVARPAKAAPDTTEERRSSARLRDKKQQDVEMTDAPKEEQTGKAALIVEASEETEDMTKAMPKNTIKPTSQITRPGELRRQVSKHAVDAAPKSKPPPVAVRTASQRVGQTVPSNSALGSSLHETLANPAPAKQAPTLKSKTSNQSIKPSASTTNLKASQSSSSRPKALEAAAKKREQEEKEAQRKADQKREADRRRAAKVEEERRHAQEQREQKLAEQRELEAKNAAQRQQTEQRRQEAIRRNEQLRQQQQQQQQERPSSQSQLRNDYRPVSRMGGEASRPPVPHINPAKPPKRYWQPEDEDEQQKRIAKPAGTAQAQQPAAKRRRTSEVEASEPSSRPTMAPPMRMSTLKNQVPTKFQQGYMVSSSQATGSSMHKSVVNANHHMQHPKTPHNIGQYANARIPFAEAPNTAGPGPASQQQHAARAQQNTYRTPGTSSKAPPPQSVAKSSPNYPNGDNISLPEINTDSEDSDEEDSFVPPDWANSPALRELLSTQQLVDPMKVFGPIAPLVMEDVFKGTSKERQAKFRKRTSSAVWTGPDKLTEEERRKDHEAREKLVKQGGWSFDPNT